jgi:hypothetical protein
MSHVEQQKGNYRGKRNKVARRKEKLPLNNYEGTYAADPPPISDNDIKKGMFNLVN